LVVRLVWAGSVGGGLQCGAVDCGASRTVADISSDERLRRSVHLSEHYRQSPAAARLFTDEGTLYLLHLLAVSNMVLEA